MVVVFVEAIFDHTGGGRGGGGCSLDSLMSISRPHSSQPTVLTLATLVVSTRCQPHEIMSSEDILEDATPRLRWLMQVL